MNIKKTLRSLNKFSEKYDNFELKSWPFFAAILVGFFAGATYKFLDLFHLLLLCAAIVILVYHRTVMGVAMRRHYPEVMKDLFNYIRHLIFKK